MRGSIAARLGLALAGLLMAGSAFAQGPGGMGPMGGPGMDGHRPPMERAFRGHGLDVRWWNNPRVIERLKLTDDQRKQFDQILLDHREKLIDLRASLAKAELEMQPLMQADQPNESAILAQIDRVAQARAELEKANARYLLALRSKLTPEQWKQVQEFRENRGAMRERWRDGHRGPGGPGAQVPDGPGSNATPPPPGPQGMSDDDGAPEEPTAPGDAGAGALQ